MNRFRVLLIALAGAACSAAELPVDVHVIEAPQSAGDRIMTVRLTIHMDGDQVARLVSCHSRFRACQRPRRPPSGSPERPRGRGRYRWIKQ